MNVIEANNLVKVFKNGRNQITAIKNISLGVPEGKITLLAGPDGAGKTTFIKMCVGLLKPTSGDLTVMGYDITTHSDIIQSTVCYMPQKFSLYEDLTVQENLDLYAKIRGLSKEESEKRFASLLKMTDLTRFTDRRAGKLSGGMKQKLGLACAMLPNPKLIILDEPCVGVDPLSRKDLWEIINQAVNSFNTTVLVSTAYIDEAEYADQICLFHEGKILFSDNPKCLKQTARNLTYSLIDRDHKTGITQALLIEDNESVIDATPLGNSVNVTLANQNSIGVIQGNFKHGNIIKREPNYEDGFMTIFRQKENIVPEFSEKITDCLDVPGSSNHRDHKDYWDQYDSRWHKDSIVNSDFRGHNDSIGDIDSRDFHNKEIIIEVKDLVKKFGNFAAVNHTSFNVRRGEIFGLLGPNGAGKTTTFKMLCGLLPATSGTLNVGGYDLLKARNEARSIFGYVAQKFSLYGNLSVYQNLEFFGSVYGLKGRELKERIKESMNEYFLTDKAKEEADQLPLGYKQRLSMAAGTIHKPQILFLDEPTSGIDPFARRVFWHKIMYLASMGTTIIITTHFLDEAEYCDRIMIQDAGKMIAIGTPEEVRAQGVAAAEDPLEIDGILKMEDVFINIIQKSRMSTNE